MWDEGYEIWEVGCKMMQDVGCKKLAGLVCSAGPHGLGTLGTGCLAWHYLDESGLGGC